MRKLRLLYEAIEVEAECVPDLLELHRPWGTAAHLLKVLQPITCQAVLNERLALGELRC